MSDTLTELFVRLREDPTAATTADLDTLILHYREKAALYASGVKEPKKTSPIDISKLNL